jgi:hypothetical protein
MKNKEKNTENRRIIGIIIRYSLLVLIGFLGLGIFYAIFRPITISAVFSIIKVFFRDATMFDNIIFFKSHGLAIIESCISGSAYFLLTILNFLAPMALIKRIPSLIFSWIVFLFLNVIRIFVSAIFFIKFFDYFDIVHLAFWYSLSTLMVVIIWIASIKLFRIESVPFYSDVKFLKNMITK